MNSYFFLFPFSLLVCRETFPAMFGLACSYSAGTMKVASIGIVILANMVAFSVVTPPCPGPAPPAPAPVDNTLMVFPFTALSFTNA
jgi:hypothetical protein